MKIPHVDLTKPDNIIKELFEDDRWVKDEFMNSLAKGCQQFSETLAPSFARFPTLEQVSKDGNKQSAMVANFIFGVLDDLVVSMKLLVSGKMNASGNLVRQAIEGMCVAMLCSSRKPILINKTDKLKYWESAMDPSDKRVESHRSINQLKLNNDNLKFPEFLIVHLATEREHFNNYSHPNLLGSAMRMKFGELSTVFVGGAFDQEKLDAYRQEIDKRIGISKVLPDLISDLTNRLKVPPA